MRLSLDAETTSRLERALAITVVASVCAILSGALVATILVVQNRDPDDFLPWLRAWEDPGYSDTLRVPGTGLQSVPLPVSVAVMVLVGVGAVLHRAPPAWLRNHPWLLMGAVVVWAPWVLVAFFAVEAFLCTG